MVQSYAPHRKQKICSSLLPAILAAAILLFFPEVIRYEGFIQRYIGIPASFILWTSGILAVIVRSLFGITFGSRMSVWMMFLSPVLLLIAVGMQLTDAILFENYVFGHLHIHPKTFADLALFVALYSVISCNHSVIIRYWKHILFSFPITAFSFFIFLSWRYRDIFYYIIREDGPVEYTEFLLFFAACGISIMALLHVRSMHLPALRKRIWVMLLGVSAVCLFFISGDEISWGQRIFQIDTPQQIRDINTQNEITIHNIEPIFSYIYHAYLLLGIYGASSWVIRHVPISYRRVRMGEYLQPILSRWYLAPYFLPIIAYVYWRFTAVTPGFEQWEEISELFLSIGIFLLFLLSYKDMQRQSRRSVNHSGVPEPVL